MKKKYLFALLALLIARPCLAQEGLTYVIGKGDTLEVSVWGFSELSRPLTVRPDGRISFPLVADEINAEGLTPMQLSQQLSAELSRELKEPKVTVIVSGFGSKKIWVLGEAVTPGAYPFTGDMTALKAIIQAGGYKNSACLENVVVIRHGRTPRPDAFVINMAKLINVKEAQLDMILEPGDVVYLPRNVISKLDNFIKFFTDKVSPAIYVNAIK